MAAGDVWAAVADHPSVDRIDRTHRGDRTSLGLWLSPHGNRSRGRFLTKDWRGGDRPLGSVVAIPAGLPFHVEADASPARRMLHCRLPVRLTLLSERLSLDSCLNLRNEIIATSLSRLAREVIDPGFGSSAIVEGLGLLIGGELERHLMERRASPRRGGLAPWQLRRIDDYLHAGHWDSSVSDLADLCGISPGHAMRAFRQSTGRSIAAHIAALRMEQACTMLTGDALSVSQIAAILRFSSSSAFTAAFRRATRLTPNGFRQQQRTPN
jgi:AraC family transcriptional regulator